MFTLHKTAITAYNPMEMSVTGNIQKISYTDHKYSTKKLAHKNITRLKKGFFTDTKFPQIVIDLETERKYKGFLPLTLSNSTIDVFHFQDLNNTFLAIETLQTGLSQDDFYVLTRAIRFLLSYLIGKPIFGNICDVVANQSGIVNDLQMFPGRNVEIPDSIFPPVPSQNRIQKNVNSPETEPNSVEALNPAIVSRSLEIILKQPELLVPIQYLIEFPNVTLELRGVLLSIAMGNLTNINHDTNRLLQPFKELGISLTDEETEAVEQGGEQLHSGRFLSLDELDQDSKKREETFKVEMSLYTAINKLLLKKLGYTGNIIDWGATGRNHNDPKLTTI